MCAKRRKDLTRVSPRDLYIEQSDDGYVLMHAEQPVLTPVGDRVIHERDDLLIHMIHEFEAFGRVGLSGQTLVEPKQLTAFAIYGVQREAIDARKECLSLHFSQCLQGDGIFYPAPGPHEEMAQRACWGPAYEWMESLGLALPSLRQYWGGPPSTPEEEEEFEAHKDDFVPPQRLIEVLEGIYNTLTAEQRAAVYALHAVHGVVVFPMLLALNKCSVNEYASGVMAIHGVVSADWSAMSVSDDEHSKAFRDYRDVARVATEWMRMFGDSPAKEVLAEIAKGESTSREFKSSLRWHLHKKQHDEVITHACLKTIAAFLNTEGGTLLIGVKDNGEVCGIEHDGFPNDDKFILHLYNYIQEWLGNQHATRIEAKVVEVNSKKVCRVECQPFAGDWAYLRRKDDEEFLVRVGPSSKPLKPSEIATYMASRKAT